MVRCTDTEQVASLKSSDAVLFDIHGEYAIKRKWFSHYKIAGPNDTKQEGVLFLPYWLLTYEEMFLLCLTGVIVTPLTKQWYFQTLLLKGKAIFTFNWEYNNGSEYYIGQPCSI